MGWFFGFKLRLVFNDSGELLNLALTPGNVDDRQPVPGLVKRLFGRLFGDKGYLSVDVRCGLIAYCHQPEKPGLHLDARLRLMPA